MDQATITEYTRRGLRNPRFSSDDITAMTLLGVHDLGQTIKMVAPAYFRGRQLLTSYTHIFNWPSDCETVLNVFDTMTDATAISAATNATPISVTSTAHGLADNDIVFISGVLGNTAANGTFKITYVSANAFTLDGSVGNAAYTSGGYVIKWSSAFRKMIKKENTDQNLSDRYKWYPEGTTIIVDWIDFGNTLLVDYIKRPDAITDIPSEYHMGLVGWNVMNLLKVPDRTAPDYADLISSYSVHKGLYEKTTSAIQATFVLSTEPIDINDTERWDLI